MEMYTPKILFYNPDNEGRFGFSFCWYVKLDRTLIGDLLDIGTLNVCGRSQFQTRKIRKARSQVKMSSCAISQSRQTPFKIQLLLSTLKP